jgi:uncharacterized membrane protein
MPLIWDKISEGAPANAGAFSHAAGGAPLARAVIWPHRSLPPAGFAWVIGITFGLLLLPLLTVLGSPVLWGLLPFAVGAVWLLWYFLRRSYRDGRLTEELCLWSDLIRLSRRDPAGRVQEWEANPYWVTVEMVEKGGPVLNYLTLSGNGRRVEIGAFLSPDERVALRDDLTRLLRQAGRSG